MTQQIKNGPNSGSWTLETYDEQLQYGFKRSELLFSEASPFHTIEVIQTPTHGRILMSDGSFIFSERDEAIYHEMIAHVPLFVHAQAKNVLVLGGGSGGIAREVIKHVSVERCTVVERDQAVVNACKAFLPQTAAAFFSPRVKLIIQDEFDWISSTKEIFDVILIDATDLISDEVYASLKKILAPKGLIVSQAESPFYAGALQANFAQILKNHFKRVHFYNFTNLTYPGGLWSLSFASDGTHPIDDFSTSRIASSGIEFEWYNSGMHEAAFLLPQFQKDHLKDFLNPL